MKRIIILTLALSTLTACGKSNKETIQGKWILEDLKTSNQLVDGSFTPVAITNIIEIGTNTVSFIKSCNFGDKGTLVAKATSPAEITDDQIRIFETKVEEVNEGDLNCYSYSMKANLDYELDSDNDKLILVVGMKEGGVKVEYRISLDRAE